MDCKNCGKPKKLQAKGLCKKCYHDAWYARNREKERARRASKYADNRAGILARAAARYAAKDPVSQLLLRKRGAKQRGIEFALTLDSIPPIPAVCPVFGLPFGGDLGPPSLDRTDNSKGYVPGNVQWISFRANSIKRDATAAELVAVANYLLKHELLS